MCVYMRLKLKYFLFGNKPLHLSLKKTKQKQNNVTFHVNTLIFRFDNLAAMFGWVIQ